MAGGASTAKLDGWAEAPDFSWRCGTVKCQPVLCMPGCLALLFHYLGKLFATNKTGAEHRGGVCNFSFLAIAFFPADSASQLDEKAVGGRVEKNTTATQPGWGP